MSARVVYRRLDILSVAPRFRPSILLKNRSQSKLTAPFPHPNNLRPLPHTYTLVTPIFAKKVEFVAVLHGAGGTRDGLDGRHDWPRQGQVRTRTHPLLCVFVLLFAYTVLCYGSQPIDYASTCTVLCYGSQPVDYASTCTHLQARKREVERERVRRDPALT